MKQCAGNPNTEQDGSHEKQAIWELKLHRFPGIDGIAPHVSSNNGLIAEDRIAHLLSCWGPDTDVGENMRMNQQTSQYIELENMGKWKIDGC